MANQFQVSGRSALLNRQSSCGFSSLFYARVAKLVDAPGLGPDASNGVGVRVPPRAPHI